MKRTRPIKALIDSGASESIIVKSKIGSNSCYRSDEQIWQTTAGKVSTFSKAKLEIELTEFSTTRKVSHVFHIVKQDIPAYDVIIGRDLMHLLKIDVHFSTSKVEWLENGKIPMKPYDATRKSHFYINNPNEIMSEADKMSHILDAKYNKANLDKIARETLHLKITSKIRRTI